MPSVSPGTGVKHSDVLLHSCTRQTHGSAGDRKRRRRDTKGEGETRMTTVCIDNKVRVSVDYII